MEPKVECRNAAEAVDLAIKLSYKIVEEDIDGLGWYEIAVHLDPVEPAGSVMLIFTLGNPAVISVVSGKFVEVIIHIDIPEGLDKAVYVSRPRFLKKPPCGIRALSTVQRERLLALRDYLHNMEWGVNEKAPAKEE